MAEDTREIADPNTGGEDRFDGLRFPLKNLAQRVATLPFRSPGELVDAMTRAAFLEATLSKHLTKETWGERMVAMWDRQVSEGYHKEAIETAKILGRHLGITVDPEQAGNNHLHLNLRDAEVIKSASTEELEAEAVELQKQIEVMEAQAVSQTRADVSVSAQALTDPIEPPKSNPVIDPESDPLFS